MRKNKLQNFSKFLGAYLATLLIALVAIIPFTSCDRLTHTDTRDYVSPSDSIYVAANMEKTLNPSFTDVPEVLTFQNKLVSEYSIDETFRSMPEETIKQVATVLLNQRSSITKKDIVTEYRANQSVYDNLGKESIEQRPQSESATIATEGQQTPVPAPRSISYHYEIDTVNGQPVKVLVKEEKYESK